MDKETIYAEIDNIIKKINSYKKEPEFSREIKKREELKAKKIESDDELLKKLSYLIAFSQNANSKRVEDTINSEKLDDAFNNFKVNEVVKLNPCDIVDKHWECIKGIRQQSKIFHIVMLARKIKKQDSLKDLINGVEIPLRIRSHTDIDGFWKGYIKLLKELKVRKIPFFQSDTSLLHFLLDNGYDCVKPDVIVMREATKLKIVEKETGIKNLREVVKFIQEYSLSRNIRPAVVDFYLLISGGQKSAIDYVNNEYYKSQANS